MEEPAKRKPTQEEIDEESRRMRRLRISVELALSVIAQGHLNYEEAIALLEATRRGALELFPGKERAFELIIQPRFRRLMNEVYRVQ
jgi:hypothetical protein